MVIDNNCEVEVIGVVKKAKSADNVLAQNKKARHDYSILETYEAGLVLTGTEIKSVRNARINLKDGLPASVMGKSGWKMFISVLMSKEISLMSIRYGIGNCYCVKKKLKSCLRRLKVRVLP